MSKARKRKPARTERLFLVDGSSYVYRAFHAIRSLSNSRGLPTNAIYGFLNMLLKVIQDHQPDYLAVVFDPPGPTFRNELYEQYKANRPPPPEDLTVQWPYVLQLVEALNIPMVQFGGFETDDVIATLARQAEARKLECTIVTGDKDLLQLVTTRVRCLDTMKDRTYDEKAVEERFGVAPALVVDVMALSGDPIDNVPGVPGIGPKSAPQLIREFGSLDALLESADRVKRPAQRRALKKYHEQALLSRELVRLRTDVPTSFEPEQFRIREPDRATLSPLLEELEFDRFARQLLGDKKAEPELGVEEERNYEVIRTLKSLDQLRERLKKAGRFALDTETTSKEPMRARLVGLSFCCREREAYYVPVGHTGAGSGRQIPLEKLREQLEPLLADPSVAKVGQNLKYDLIVLERAGLPLRGIAGDSMLASYVLDPSRRSHSLDNLARDVLGRTTTTYEQVAGKGKKQVSFDLVPVDRAAPYACEDAEVTWCLTEKLEARLRREKLWKLYEEVELPLLEVLARMEIEGVKVEASVLEELGRELEAELEKHRRRAHELAGETFKLDSPKQLQVILFDKLALPRGKKTKTGYSTSSEVLENLAADHEIAALLLEYRSLAKLKHGYLDAIPELIHPETGRIHTSFNQAVTATGRLSSSDPNLQNIPVRTPLGRRLRSAFVPEQGCLFFSADYSQIELRILAQLSKDPLLIESFRKGEDVHARTASEVFGVPAGEVGRDIRRRAKAINFGIIYGMSAFGLSRELGIDARTAQEYIDGYFLRYAGVREYLDEEVAKARRRGYAATLLGRRRPLPDLKSSVGPVKRFAERTAVNTPIQGTAADLIKVAMVRIQPLLASLPGHPRMLLQVHDELLFEVKAAGREALAECVKREMESALELEVPLIVDVKSGTDWASLKKS